MAKGYKLFRMKGGKLYPLFVLANEPLPIGKWLEARTGNRTENGKVESKLGELAFRPGWHVNDLPYVEHIYSMHDGRKHAKDGCVWCEVEYSTEVDYSEEAKAAGWKNGKWSATRAFLDKVPVGGCYRYKTNPQMFGEWAIAGEMRIIRIVDDDEVERICAENGLTALPRWKKGSDGKEDEGKSE